MKQRSEKLRQFVPFLDHFLVQIEQMYFPNFPKKLATIWALPGSPLIPQSGQTNTLIVFLHIANCISLNCKIYFSKLQNIHTFPNCNIFLSELNNSWWQFELYRDHVLSLNLDKPTLLAECQKNNLNITYTYKLYLSKLQNIFLQITKYITQSGQTHHTSGETRKSLSPLRHTHNLQWGIVQNIYFRGQLQHTSSDLLRLVIKPWIWMLQKHLNHYKWKILHTV